LRRLRRRFAGERLDGISIHEQLLDRDTVASLRAIADVIMTWPVNRPERASELLRLGIDGLITDDVAGLSSAGVLEATA
jgi:glycerophosphoryl diester phosphodiesterase